MGGEGANRGIAFACGICFLFSAAVLTGLTALKESPSFWLNSGGYPVALREFVLNFYYPAMLLHLTFLSGFTLSHAARLTRRPRLSPALYLLALFPAWLLTAIAVGLLLANNVINLLEGRPFHHH